MAYQTSFRRKEVKFRMDAAQTTKYMAIIKERIEPDAFPHSSISNLYYDTLDFRLIRRSLEKPDFKEKLRLRCYETPQEHSEAFLEIKRKVEGVVYKRRACLPYRIAADALKCGAIPAEGQIFREIEWMYHLYPGLRPAMFLSYERDSFRGREDPALRLTFDREIRWRAADLDAADGNYGQPLLKKGECLLEIKIAGAMPLWLVKALSECGIRRTSFSKYGKAYESMLCRGNQTEVKKYA